jgi:TPR repeat protein
LVSVSGLVFYREKRLAIDPAEEVTNGLEQYDLGDFVNAAPHFKAAAERGNAEAQYHFGEMLYHGEGLVEKKAESIQWLRKSAEKGYSPAEASLAIALYFGEGVPKDTTEAKIWAERSASQGEAYGLYVLAGIKSVERDEEGRLKLLFQAAQQDYAPAEVDLAALLLKRSAGGRGNGDLDPFDAADWLKKAGNQGNRSAQLAIGMFLATLPPGETTYYDAAYKMLLLGLRPYKSAFSEPPENIMKDARRTLKTLEEKLTTQQKLDVRSEVQNWQPETLRTYRHGH